MNICSLLPSATEIVYALGLGDQLVAVTHECDFPEPARMLPQVTESVLDHLNSSSAEIDRHIRRALHEGSSVYRIRGEIWENIRFDLVLTQELCDVCAVSYRQVERAVRRLDGDQVILSLEPLSLSDILETVRQVALAAGVADRGRVLTDELSTRLQTIREAAADLPRPSVVCLEWLDPLFKGGHWVPEMVDLAGGIDQLGIARQPSTEMSYSDVEAADADIILLMPCGYDLERTVQESKSLEGHHGWASLRAVKSGRVFALDGSGYFNRPGPRVIDGVAILSEIFHPGVFGKARQGTEWLKL